MIENTTINSRTTTENWMQLINPQRLISSLTIPGTHDTMTYDLKYPNIWNECQDISLTEQLERGIRFIDIRLRYDDNEDGALRACHGDFDCDIFFPQIVQLCKDFLTKNPTECILMSIKNESGDWGDHFTQTIYNTVTEDQPHWYYGHDIPKLADVKGKIVLLRRYKEENPSFQSKADIGLNLTNWPDDTSFIRPDSGNPCTIKYTVQDVYDTNINRTYKFNKDVKPMLNNAINDTDMNRLYFNFTSATGAICPSEVADYTLEYMMDYLNDGNVKFGRYGIIPMDFPQKDRNGNIITKLISMNLVDNISTEDEYVIHSSINPHFVLDVKGDESHDGTEVILYEFNRQSNQHWKFEASDDAFYLISQNATDKGLTSKDSQLQNFNNLVIAQRNNPQFQGWLINNTENHDIQFKLKFAPQFAIDIAYAKMENGASICLYQYSATDKAELFRLSLVI